MARRDYGWLDLLEESPWWVSVVAAVMVYLFLAYGAAAIPAGPMWEALAKATPGIAWMAWFLLVPGAFSALHTIRKRSQLARQTHMESIKSLSWKQFEELIGEAYRRRGFTVRENSDLGADGGVDLVVSIAGRRYLVQCKHWKSAKVGVKVVREMLGLVIAYGATGAVIMTTGSFTQEAEAFAMGQPVELLAGREVLEFVKAAQGAPRPTVRASEPVLHHHAAAELAVTCPRCGNPLKLREAKKGKNAGREFLGCSAFPKCRYTEDVSS